MVHLGMDRRGLVQYSRDLMLCSDMYKKRLDWISSGKSLFTWYMYTSYPTPSLTPPQTILPYPTPSLTPPQTILPYPTPSLVPPLHKPSFLPHSFPHPSTNHPSYPTPSLAPPLRKPSFLPHSFPHPSTNHPSVPHSFLSSSTNHPSLAPPLTPPFTPH